MLKIVSFLLFAPTIALLAQLNLGIKDLRLELSFIRSLCVMAVLIKYLKLSFWPARVAR